MYKLQHCLKKMLVPIHPIAKIIASTLIILIETVKVKAKANKIILHSETKMFILPRLSKELKSLKL